MHRDTAFLGRLRGYPPAFGFALVSNALFFFSFQSIFPVLPRFIAEIVVSKPPEAVGGQVGLAVAVTVVLAVLTRIPAGQLTDRLGKRRFMLIGAICFTVAPLIYAASHGMPLLLLGRMAHGVGLSVFTTPFQALAAELAPEDRRGEALGLAGASTSLAFVSAPMVGDWLATNHGYVLMFQVSAAVAAMSAVMVLMIAAPTEHSSESLVSRVAPLADLRWIPGSVNKPQLQAAAGVRLALAQKGVRAGVLTMAALGIPFGAFLTFLPLYAEERHIAGVGVVYSVYAGTVLLAQPLSGWLADRVGRRGVMLPGLAITGLAAGLLALNGSLMVLALSGIVLGLGSGLTRGGVDPLVQDSVPTALRGTAAAVQYTSFDFWIGVGSYPVGILANAVGYDVAFIVTGIISMLGGGCLAMMLREPRRVRNKADQ